MSDFPTIGDDAFAGSGDDMSEVLTPLLTTFFAVLICFLCCCKTEESPDDPAHDRIVGGIMGNPLAESTPPQTLEQRRTAIDAALIKREVVAAEQSVRNPSGAGAASENSSTRKLMKGLSSRHRTYSSFVAAFQTRNSSSRKVVKFSAPVLRRAQSAPSVAMNRLSGPVAAASDTRLTTPTSERLTSSTIGSGMLHAEGGTVTVSESQEPPPPTEDIKEESKQDFSEEEPAQDAQPQDKTENDDDVEDDARKSVLRRRKSNIVARKLASVLRMGETNYDEPTTCDICLMEYEVGDQVAWSPNDACPHAFHTECITDWLLRNPTCPLCRNDYCHVSHPDGEGGHQHNHAHGDHQV